MRIVSIRPTGFLLPFVTVLFGLLGLPGCGDDGSSPQSVELPEIAGAVVPETVEEGSSVEVEIWGTAPHGGWALHGFDVQEVAIDEILVVPVGAGGDPQERDRPESFRGTAVLPSVRSGDLTVRVWGASGTLDFPMHVFPRNPIVRLLVRGGPDAVHEELVIGPGWAMAFRRGERRPHRIELSTEEVDEARRWFHDAGFFELEPRYVGDEPNGGLFFDLSFREADRRRRVLAEGDLAPEPLQILIRELRLMIDSILQGDTDRVRLIGRLTVEPVEGEGSVERTLRLTLENHGDETVALLFPTAQIYDLAVFTPHRPNDIPPGGGGPGDGSPPCDNEPVGQGGSPDYLVWNWAHHRDFAQVESKLTLEPGESVTYEETWDCSNNEGTLVEDGRYQALGFVVGRPRIPIRPVDLLVGSPPHRLQFDFSIEPPVGPPGSMRELHFTILNPQERTVVLEYPDNQHYDFHISDPRMMRPTPIWSWSYGRGFTDQPTTLTIPAGERIRFVERWDGKTNEGTVVAPGDYTVVGVLTLRNPITSTIERLRVVK